MIAFYSLLVAICGATALHFMRLDGESVNEYDSEREVSK